MNYSLKSLIAGASLLGCMALHAVPGEITVTLGTSQPTSQTYLNLNDINPHSGTTFAECLEGDHEDWLKERHTYSPGYEKNTHIQRYTVVDAQGEKKYLYFHGIDKTACDAYVGNGGRKTPFDELPDDVKSRYKYVPSVESLGLEDMHVVASGVLFVKVSSKLPAEHLVTVFDHSTSEPMKLSKLILNHVILMGSMD